MDGSVIFLEQLFYRIHIFFVLSVKCLCEDRDPFAKFLKKILGMGIFNRLLL